MGAQNSLPLQEGNHQQQQSHSAKDLLTISNSKRQIITMQHPPDDSEHESFEVVKISRSMTQETESSESEYEDDSPQQILSKKRNSSSYDSSCQSPIPCAPQRLPKEFSLQIVEGGECDVPPPPPPPTGPPPPREEESAEEEEEEGPASFLPFGTCSAFTDMTETVTEFFDPSNFTCDASSFFDPSSYAAVDPMKYWWEQNSYDDHDQPSPMPITKPKQQEEPVLSRRDSLLMEATKFELSGDLPAALGCYKECMSIEQPNTLLAQVYHKTGVLHWKAGDYAESLQVLQECITLYQEAFGFFEQQDAWICNNASSKAQTLSQVLNSLGRVHLSLGKLTEASRDLKQALQLVKIAHDLDQESTTSPAMASALARTKVGLGMAQDAKGKPLRAKKYYQEALDIYRSLEICQLDVASCLNSMGAIHEQGADYEQAMDCYTEALVIYREQLVLGKCSPVDVAVTLNNIGFIHHVWGEFTSAMTAYADAVGILESVLGKHHRNVASARHNIGLVHAERGSHREAIQIFKHVLQCQRISLGKCHPDVAITLDSVSNSYQSLQQGRRAIRYLEKSLSIRQQSLGDQHLLVALTYEKLGRVYMQEHDWKRARIQFHEALSVYKNNKLSEMDCRVHHVREYLAEVDKQTKEFPDLSESRSFESVDLQISLSLDSISSSSTV